MNIRVIAVATTMLLCIANNSFAVEATLAWQEPGFVMEEVIATAPAPADSAMLAWQEPGFVMEEVIATAPAPTDSAMLAWQEPGFVMEEVVVTANASEVLASARQRTRSRLRAAFAADRRANLLRRFRARGADRSGT